MTLSKWPALCLLALMAAAVCSAQHFPLRSGEWTSATPNPMSPNSPPMNMLFCMDDATWTKALKGSPTCSLQQSASVPAEEATPWFATVRICRW